MDANIRPQTQRVNDGRRTLANRKQALEFLIHFIGDITQPLHDEAEALGGNQIAVTWKGDPTNLHATWDTQMVEQDAGGGNTTAILMAFAAKLEAAIDTGAYASQKASWVKCANVATAVCWVISSTTTLFASFFRCRLPCISCDAYCRPRARYFSLLPSFSPSFFLPPRGNASLTPEPVNMCTPMGTRCECL